MTKQKTYRKLYHVPGVLRAPGDVLIVSSTADNQPPCGATHVAIGEEVPIRKPRREGLLIRRDAARRWIPLHEGEAEFTQLLPNYFSAVAEEGEDRDICLYCGSDTTDLRISWDCFFCGSN